MATPQIIETLDSAIARHEWHKAVKEFGLSRCRVKRIEVENGSPIYRITIN